jgi:hypothetical protein
MTTLVYTLYVHYDTIHGIECKKMIFTSRDEAEKFRKRGGVRGYYVTSLSAQVVFDADRAARFIQEEKDRINAIGQVEYA